MRTATLFIVGAVSALPLLALARACGRYAGLVCAAALVLAALVYVGFAVRAGQWGLSGVEWLGLVLFTAGAWAGLKSPRLLAMGWAAHAVWDLCFYARAGAVPYVPEWYAAVCAGFDLAVAAYLTFSERV